MQQPGKESVRQPFLVEENTEPAVEPAEDELPKPAVRGGKRTRVLIVPPPGLLSVLLAEPAIRAFGQAETSSREITICHEYADLFIGHPGVRGLAYGDAGELNESFDKVIYLRGEPRKGAAMDWMFDAAGQLGVRLEHQTPQIILNSFDFVRTQRFGLSKVPRPRVVLAPLSDSAESWLAAHSVELAQLLKQKLGAGLVYAGGGIGPAAEGAKDLRGKLTAREIAAVLQQCDLLISEEEETAALAAAIHLPIVYLGKNSWDCWPRKEGSSIISICPAGPEDVLGAVARLNPAWNTGRPTEGTVQ